VRLQVALGGLLGDPTGEGGGGQGSGWVGEAQGKIDSKKLDIHSNATKNG
jgi:hypothetical protein